MKFDKKFTPLYRFNSNRSRSFGVWTLLRWLLQGRRYQINSLKKLEKPTTSHRIADVVIWIAGLIVLTIAFTTSGRR